MELGGDSHFKHSSVKILITLENKNSSPEFKRNKNHISRKNQVIQIPTCSEAANSSDHMARDATAFWQKTKTTKVLEV